MSCPLSAAPITADLHRCLALGLLYRIYWSKAGENTSATVQLQAVESKKEDAKIAYVEKGLEVAVTDAARAKLVRPHYCSSLLK